MAGRRTLRRVRLNAPAAWRVMDRLGLSQNEVARRAGLSSGYMSQLVNGERSPSPRTQRRLLRVLGVERREELFVREAVHGT